MSSSSVSEADFNSEDAFCGATMSSGEQGPSEVEIVGMDLLFSDEQGQKDDMDDSETDSSEEELNEQLQHTVDSIELARQRLGEGHHHRNSNRRHRRSRRVFFPNEEVDSLILARKRLPHHVNDDNLTEDVMFLVQLFEEGRGLMGEVDSLELDRKRLPHLVHHRETVHGLFPQQRTWELVTAKGSPKICSDDESTESDESFSSYFTVETVDSLILARRRLASHRRRPYSGAKVGSGDIHQHSKPATGTTGESSKLPEKPGIGLGPGLCRQSSSACAA